jgi:LmbE family N-acetylglucosaminyl deacetylase
MKRFIDTLWFERFRQLPHFRSPGILALPVTQRVLVVAPHSDDEWIGCGGTLARLCENHCLIRVVVVTDGALGDPEGLFDGDAGEKRRGETLKVLGTLGIEDVCFLNFPDGDLGSQGDALVGAVAEAYDAFAPDWVLTTAMTEHHRDHVCVGYVVMRHWLARRAGERLLAYEVYGSIRLDWLVDITSVMDLKRQLLRHYEIPLRYVDYDAACVSLARYRGVFVGSPLEDGFAEGFMEIRPRDVYRSMLGVFL